MRNVSSELALETEIIVLLRNELGLSETRSIDQSTRINADLGVAGDDGIALISAIEKRFNVDMRTFPIQDYFGSEAGISPFAFLRSLGRMLVGRAASDLQPLSVGDLVRFIESKATENRAIS